MADEVSAPEEECKCEKGAPKWVVTFGDMMSLLLTFFVLLLSFSSTDVKKFKRMAGSVKEAFGVAKTSPDHTTPMGKKIIHSQIEIPKSMAQLATVRAKAAKTSKKSEVEMESGSNWFRLKIEGDALFDSGSWTIKPEADPILNQVATLVNDFDGTVKIEGHTDTDAAGSSRFVGEAYLANYELAMNRAISVMDFLVGNHSVDKIKLVPISFGEAKPRDSNASEEGRARNRRVEFEFRAGSKANINDSTGSRIEPQ